MNLTVLYRFLTVVMTVAGLSYTGWAQSSAATEKPVNQYDGNGKQDGLWYVSNPGGKGEPGTSILGNYDHGEKTGTWYISTDHGDMISIENFRHNVRDGEVQYFEGGRLTTVGHYRGLNPKVALDSFMLTDPITGEEKLMVVPTERGSVRHGIWRFYDDMSGKLVREEQYQMDELIASHEFRYSSADSSFYEQRNKHLPHNGGKYEGRVFRQKNPTKSFLDN
ncbi:hypothetical protein [Rurimicrobium arvi]|uniref:MORN repeat variant n=1 Tax=Rurimicrobium arvi TaxID=2049916 RepID=A0ABP8MCZ7_9BACT